MESLYTSKAADNLRPAVISLAFIYQHLENNVNQCVSSIASVSELICIILKTNQNIVLTVQTSFVYLLHKGLKVLLTIGSKRDPELSWIVASVVSLHDSICRRSIIFFESGHNSHTTWRSSKLPNKIWHSRHYIDNA